MPQVPALDLADDGSLTPIRHGGDVRFAGTIASGRPVQVGGGLTVLGDVVGALPGAFTVSGDLRCRSIRSASTMVRGDVFVQGDLAHGRVICGGRIDMPDGALYGGDLSANGGLTCRTLGHPDGTPTLVEAGVGRMLRLLCESVEAQIESRRQQAEVMRASIEPLTGQMKSLSPQQREKVTEMLYQASELDAATNSLAAAFEQRKNRTAAQARPMMTVIERVHAGVTVQLDATAATLTAPIEGPVTITCRKTDGVTEIVAIATKSGATAILATGPIRAAA